MDGLLIPIEFRQDESRESPGRLVGVLLPYEVRAGDRPEMFEQGALRIPPEGVLLREMHRRDSPIMKIHPYLENLPVRQHSPELPAGDHCFCGVVRRPGTNSHASHTPNRCRLPRRHGRPRVAPRDVAGYPRGGRQCPPPSRPGGSDGQQGGQGEAGSVGQGRRPPADPDQRPDRRGHGSDQEVACRPRRLGRGSRLEFEADATSRGLVDIAIASVMRDAMLRPSEATALRWADVESLLDGAGQIHIHRDSADPRKDIDATFPARWLRTSLLGFVA